jgi:hypothetical protein
MNRILTLLALGLLVFTLAVSAASAQEKDAQIPERGGLLSTPQENGRGSVLVSITFPKVKTGPFNDAAQDQKSEAWGAPGTVAVGWEPFSKHNVPGFLKHIGFEGDLTILNKPGGFDTPLFSYTVIDEIPLQYRYGSGYGYGNGYPACYGGYGCGYCSYSPGYACVYSARTVTVYERDALVKYSDGSGAVGFYVTEDIARRISLQGGLNVRFHNIVEGYRTDMLTRDWQRSTGATLKVGYIWKKATIGFAMEKSINGMKYTSKGAMIGIRF